MDAYKVTPGGRLYLDGVEVVQDDRAASYITYVAWLAKGNGPGKIEEIEPPDAPDPAEELGEIGAELAKLEERVARLRAALGRPLPPDKEYPT